MHTPQSRALPYDAACPTEDGFLAVRLQGVAVSELALCQDRPAVRPDPATAALQVLAAVQDYLASGVAEQLPPLALRGTSFQQRVWASLRAIPRGQTRTYGEIARELGTSARAVGGACRANPALILVPCHRVVASGGAGGFAGHTEGFWPQVKRRWLAAEGVRLS